jgi:hypothetical protein
MGQESNLHPAVVEHAARCPGPSNVVYYRLELALLGGTSSKVVQGRPRTSSPYVVSVVVKTNMWEAS